MKAVIFDCFGVLYGGSTTYFTSLAPTKKPGIQDLNNQHDYGYISFDEYAAGIAGITGLSVPDVKDVMRQRHVRRPDVFALLERVRQSGAKTGLLTNMGNHMVTQMFSEQELNGGLFDAYVASSDVGMIKPSVEIFQLIAERLGVPPEACLMIDDLEPNCNGAELAGMQSVWFADSDTAGRHIDDFLRST